MSITFYRSPGRTLTTWRPVYSMGLMDDIDQIAKDFWSSWKPGFFGDGMVPHTDMHEEKGQLVISTELPGVTEDDLDVTIEDNMLTIKAEKKEEVAEDATPHTKERYYGKYVRTISLPSHINEEDISATLNNGVLEIRLPKADLPEPKKIEVKAQLPEKKSKKNQAKSTKKSS